MDPLVDERNLLEGVEKDWMLNATDKQAFDPKSD